MGDKVEREVGLVAYVGFQETLAISQEEASQLREKVEQVQLAELACIAELGRDWQAELRENQEKSELKEQAAMDEVRQYNVMLEGWRGQVEADKKKCDEALTQL